MKFVTWNVNGLRACIDKGLKDYLLTTDADVIALQETKTNMLLPEPFLDGYGSVWNSGERPGYSGTACFYKKKPLSITRGFGNERFDKEGRLITLEYPAFYFVNVYVPKSQDGLDRWSYRLNWDAVFAEYLTNLQKRKPVIVCGDFNVARDYIDIYPENLRNIEKPYGFLTEERDGFNALLDTGMTDVFRELHPDKEQAYTWWSNRLKKRKQNRGWRLDYFLATDSLMSKVQSCEIKSNIQGSDHAPVELRIELDKITDEALEKSWREIQWKKAEDTLVKLQRDIAFAAIRHNDKAISDAQKRLVRSLDAKVLAVRHVCDSTTQPGIDGVKWEDDADKMRAALALDSKGYAGQPMRLLIVTPRGQTKQRHIQIPTHFDKAMQVLYAFSLDPVSESTGERKSFAFRKGRGAYDIHAYIIKTFDMYNPPRYIVKADVKACYASISHDWLMNNIPMDVRILKEFLKAGYVFRDELFPADDFGISIGASISPILANMTLDGAQKAIFDGLYGENEEIDYANGNLIRFADDILVSARTMESAEEIKQILSSFLAVRGLTLSEQKTRIIDLADGFEFLSRHYQYSDGFVYAAPSEAAIARMEKKMSDLITNYRGSQKSLIEKINKKLTGWASYHKITEAEQAFRRIDNVVKILLLELCEKLNPHLPRDKIISKYFYREANGEYIYALSGRPDIRIFRLADTILIKHKPVATKMNPYIDDDYYEERTDERAIMSVTGKYKPIWKRQRGKCFYCGRAILKGSRKTIVTINPSRSNNPKNLAYVHESCGGGQAEFYESDWDIDSPFDLHELLLRMENKNPDQTGRKSKFWGLAAHFRQRDEAIFTLTFKEIEKIIGQPLCDSALKTKQYWHRRGDKNISFCWLSNGYAIKNLYLEKARIVFERTTNLGGTVKIPPAFLSGRIPHDAKVEFENMLEYIRKKYGI